MIFIIRSNGADKRQFKQYQRVYSLSVVVFIEPIQEIRDVGVHWREFVQATDNAPGSETNQVATAISFNDRHWATGVPLK